MIALLRRELEEQGSMPAIRRQVLERELWSWFAWMVQKLFQFWPESMILMSNRIHRVTIGLPALPVGGLLKYPLGQGLLCGETDPGELKSQNRGAGDPVRACEDHGFCVGEVGEIR